MNIVRKGGHTSKYLSFGRMFTKVVKCKPDIML